MSRRRRPRGRFRRRALFLLLVLAAVAGYGSWLLTPPAAKGAAKVVDIAPRQSARAVAAMLRKEGLLRSDLAFLALAYATGKYRHLQSGGYALSPTMSASEVLDALYRGTHRAWSWLTIPEGYTVRQIAGALSRKHLADADAFLALTRQPAPLHPDFPVPATGLEGYLFPDTYRIDANASAPRITAQMLQRFRDVVWRQLFKGRPTCGTRTLNEVIILASLVEAEAKLDPERPVIAGVLMNRLQRGQRLECDATVQYALGADRKQRLLYKDLELDSEYNTYLHAGLPPGPICSPGKASIEAALQPARVPYLYYVAKPDGSHLFSATFAQHRAAIASLRSSPQGVVP